MTLVNDLRALVKIKKKLYRSLSVLILKSDSCLPKKKFLFALMIALETLWKMLFISF